MVDGGVDFELLWKRPSCDGSERCELCGSASFRRDCGVCSCRGCWFLSSDSYDLRGGRSKMALLGAFYDKLQGVDVLRAKTCRFLGALAGRRPAVSAQVALEPHFSNAF